MLLQLFMDLTFSPPEVNSNIEKARSLKVCQFQKNWNILASQKSKYKRDLYYKQ